MLSPIQRIIANIEHAAKEEEEERKELSSEGEESMGSEDEGDSFQLNFGRPPKPEECLSDDEVWIAHHG